MMKISKPVLTNDFLLSPVQFTSLNTIVFKNVKNIYDGNEKILLEYEHSSKIEASSRDWIGIFPRGWSTLQQYVTFEWVSQSLPSGNNDKNKENGDLTRRAVNFCLKYHMGSINSNSFYQFVYISKQIEVLGVSSYFRFDGCTTGDASLELECLVPVSNKLRSTSVSDIGVLMANKISSTTSLDTRTLQTTSIHSLQNLEVDGKNWTKPNIPMTMSELKKPSFFSKKSTGTGDALDPYSSHSEPVFPMSFPMAHCKKCFHFKRGGEFLRSQQVLQSKVGPRSEEASEFNGQRRTLGHEYLSEEKLKIVMERNKILEDRTQEMKKEMERLQNESKRLKTSFYNTNKEKVAYEKFVKDFIKSLEKDSVVRVVNGNTEFLVKKVNYVGMEEHPRDKKTSKRERELKAVIGLQEITIRNLINSLQEKAKSVQELNQTVKLAQAFSAARNDTREYGSDAEETLDEVSSSDVTSEYEFSLTKPSPPEEVTVEDTDAVLDGIRKATEMELKDIGISRSLGKSSSRDSTSEIGFPSLSVRSYQSEGTQPKKPRLFDNADSCSPFAENTTKIVQRKIIEPNPNFEDETNNEKDPESTEAEISSNGEGTRDSNSTESFEPVQQDSSLTSEMEGDHGNCESYYDACEVFNSGVSPVESNTVRETLESPEMQEITVSEEKSEDDKKDKKNFLVTAIIPHDLDVKPETTVKDWLKVEKGDSEEKKLEAPEKAKKFSCQLSIDFATKVLQTPEGTPSRSNAIENGVVKDPHNHLNNTLDVILDNSQVQLKEDSQSEKEKPVLSFKKSNKCLEIQITQVDQKEKSTKNYLHQKMVVKFENDAQQEVDAKSSKFEFNLAVTGLGEKAKLLKTEPNESDLQHLANEENMIGNAEANASPRTVWNDAADDIAEASFLEINQDEIQPQQPEEGVEDMEEEEGEEEEEEEEDEEEEEEEEEGKVVEKQEAEVPEEPKEESLENTMNLYEDSLRYEKNLEFLQQKKEETIKEEEVSKNKPTAILIQNGQTKLALIRYQ